MAKVDTAIRPGMEFRLKGTGDVYKVWEDKAFGRVEIFCKARSRFGFATKQDLRNTDVWEKI